MSASLRVGIVGVGWGALVHGPAYQLVDGYELVALCGRRSEPLAQAAARLEVEDTSTDWESFVRRDDLDLVSIVLPVQLHSQVFHAALAAGKHVLCEKPLCLTGSEGRGMVSAAQDSDRQTAVCFENRWSPERLAIWDHVAAGELGQVFYAQITQTAPYWHPSRPLQSPWMYRLDEGGGYLNGMASHGIDFLQTLFGPVAEVCADVRSSVPVRPRPDGGTLDVDADDTSALILRMASGTLAVITTSVVGRNSDSQVSLALGSEGTAEILRAGGQGSARWSAPGSAESVVLAPSERSIRSGRALPPRRSAAAVKAQAFMLEDWLPAFSGQPTNVPSVRDAWLVQEVIDAARRSSAGEGWVRVPVDAARGASGG